VSKARIAGVFYLLTFLTGGFALLVRSKWGVVPPLAKSLYPHNLAPGIVGEGALTLWLLFKGVAVPGPARSA
jgi:hypothetical protein